MDLTNQLADAEAAYALILKRANEWGVDVNRIGMIGFSAGGMVTLDVAINHTEQTKPNVIGLIYGVFGAQSIPSDPMPLFMAATQYETTGNAAALYGVWCNAKQPSEIHSFTDARHGFGYRSNGDSVNIWIDLFYNFLKKIKFLE
jgi:acetyl esterase/lipase